MNIEPLESLASSIHSGKGVYALLLGSGVSQSAQVPTGWEVTVLLAQRLADRTVKGHEANDTVPRGKAEEHDRKLGQVEDSQVALESKVDQRFNRLEERLERVLEKV